MERLDLILFGATGFTGTLVAEHLAAEAPARLSWAIAGRDRAKLEALAERLRGLGGAGAAVRVRVADVGDPESLRALAAGASVVASTVGPFARYGLPVVEACVEGGAHYCDITGEPGFVATMIERYDERARAARLRLVPCCGFDSIPHDLAAWLAARSLLASGPIRVEGFVRASGRLSGGTWTSAIEALGGLGGGLGRSFPQIRQPDRTVGSTRPSARYEKRLRRWVAPMPTIDPLIVLRSASLLPEYGPQFRYGHYLVVGSLPGLLVLGATVGSVAALSRFAPTRALLLKYRKPGEGPTEQERSRGRFKVVCFGEGSGQRVRSEVAGGDPGYTETSRMLAESALSLALDALPERFGVLTPVAALGDQLLSRLRGLGFGIEIEGSAEA